MNVKDYCPHGEYPTQKVKRFAFPTELARLRLR